MADRCVRSASGGIQVTTTERGLPVALKINSRELARSPQELAHDILLLCKLSATRAQIARRRALASSGVNSDIIRALNLATDDDLARIELEIGGEPDDQPNTWMRPV
jgi:hypothetical protein